MFLRLCCPCFSLLSAIRVLGALRYDLSQLFSKFYSVCQVGNAETPEIKASRLALCVLVVNTLKVGFDLIGLKTLDVM